MSENQNLGATPSGSVQIKGDSGWLGVIVFAVIWNFLAWPFALLFYGTFHSHWLASIVVSFFPLVGLALIFLLIRTYLIYRSLGNPLLSVVHSGISGKEPFQAKIQFHPPLGQRLGTSSILHSVKVRLVCSRDDESAEPPARNIWEQVVEAKYPRGTRELAFSVELPASLPVAADFDKRQVRDQWHVILEAFGATLKYRVAVNSASVAREAKLPVYQTTAVKESLNSQPEYRRVAPRWIKWIIIFVLALMFWDFAGDQISPVMHSYVHNILHQGDKSATDKGEHVKKTGKLVPVQLDSLAGNGFGVVAKVTGQMVIGEDEVFVYPESIELRSIYHCEPDCPYIRSVHFSLTRDEGGHFSMLSESQKIPVEARLGEFKSQFVKLARSQKKIFLEVPEKVALADLRLTLAIEGDVKGKDEVHQASWYTHTQIFRIVLGEPAPPLHIGSTQEERLKQARKAVLEDRESDLGQLLEAGVEVNSRDEQGVTLLMIAAERKNLPAVKILLHHGADVNLSMPKDKEGNGGNTALFQAVRQDAADVVDVLLSAGAEMDAVANQVWTPVHYAAYRGSVKTMRLFQARKINIDEAFKGARGSTPLMLAAQNDQSEMIRILLEMGADPARKDIYGENACGYAKFFNKPGAIAVLKCR